MTKNNRKPLIALVALSAALAMPLAFAQEKTEDAATQQRQEASANAGLSQVFDQADADTDGKLTADEYKAFVSKNYGDQQK